MKIKKMDTKTHQDEKLKQLKKHFLSSLINILWCFPINQLDTLDFLNGEGILYAQYNIYFHRLLLLLSHSLIY